MKQTDYNCTIGELYGVCRTGWHSYEEFLAALAGLEQQINLRRSDPDRQASV